MELKKSFEKFIEKINLDDTRSGKIQSAHNSVRAYLEKDEKIKEIYYETFLQGSYRLNTAVRPQGDGEYDVDVILSMNLNDENGRRRNADGILDFVKRRLDLSDDYKGRTKKKNRCIELKYADNFHLDITPAHCNGNTDDPLEIPTDWKKTHPKGFRTWCIDKHAATAEMFYPVVKMLKWWRNIHFGDDGLPKSILLTTMAGNKIPDGCDDLGKCLTLTMEAVNDFIKPYSISVPEVRNPSLASEVLSENWSLADFMSFKSKFNSATQLARKAVDEKDEQKSIDLWNSNDLFADTFPKTRFVLEDQAREFNDGMQSGKLGVSSSGLLGVVGQGTVKSVPPTKYYGDEKGDS